MLLQISSFNFYINSHLKQFKLILNWFSMNRYIPISPTATEQSACWNQWSREYGIIAVCDLFINPFSSTSTHFHIRPYFTHSTHQQVSFSLKEHRPVHWLLSSRRTGQSQYSDADGGRAAADVWAASHEMRPFSDKGEHLVACRRRRRQTRSVTGNKARRRGSRQLSAHTERSLSQMNVEDTTGVEKVGLYSASTAPSEVAHMSWKAALRKWGFQDLWRMPLTIKRGCRKFTGGVWKMHEISHNLFNTISRLGASFHLENVYPEKSL